LQSWIQEDREFLLWRQNLNVAIAEWKRVNEDTGALLTGTPLELAKDMMVNRADDLNENETVYINRCVAEEERRRSEQIEREEREKQHNTERKKLQQKAEELIENRQQAERRRRLRVAFAIGATLLLLIVAGWWGYRRQILLEKAADLTAEGNEIAKENVVRAVEKYNEAIRLVPSYALAYSSRGRAYLKNGRFQEALADFDEAIRLDVNNANAYVGRGDVYWQMRRPGWALTDYNRAIEIDPKLSDAYTKRGKVLAAQGAKGEAVDNYNRAIELSPKDPIPLLWRGEARSISRDYDRALEDINQALTLKPDLTEGYRERADTLLKRNGAGDSKQAIDDYTTAFNLGMSYDPALHLNRGRAYINIGDFKLAIADFERVIKLSQDKPEYAEIKADALKEWQKLQPKSMPTPPVLSTTLARTNPTIYLHYRDINDLPMLDKIAAALTNYKRPNEPNYKVARKYELVTQSTTGDVRYFHQEDETDAARIKQIVERTLKAKEIPKTLDLKPLPRLGDRVPQGWIEVWLPSLPAPSSRIQRPAQNIPYQPRPRPQSQSKEPYGKKGASAAPAAFDLSRALIVFEK
ncbi:MAG: tetratricopeptide repeat protein, partial [Blastocatellia bacterium]